MRIAHNNNVMENKTKALSHNFRRNMDLRITSRDLHPVDVERAFQFVPYWGITRPPEKGRKKGKKKGKDKIEAIRKLLKECPRMIFTIKYC